MKKIILNGLCLLIALLSGISLFVLKYHVKAEERELKKIHREILQNKREIHMLEAEWAYLNDPQRLLALVQSQTDWQNISPKQLIVLTDIPMRPIQEETEIESESETTPETDVKPKTGTKTETENKVLSETKSVAVKTTAKTNPEKKEEQPSKNKKMTVTKPQNTEISLNSLAQNAKTLTPKSNRVPSKKTTSKQQLSGSSQKDFVWSAPKKNKSSTGRTLYKRGGAQ